MTAPAQDPSVVTTLELYCDPAVMALHQLKVSGFAFLISPMGLSKHLASNKHSINNY